MKPAPSFYFDPSAAGLAVFLGPTEAKLMELIWKHQKLTVKGLVFHLSADTSLAYTTVATVLNRLSDKGLLHRQKVGRTFEYSPNVEREGFLAERIKLVRSCLQQNF